MTDTTPAQAATPEPQAGDGQQTEPKQPEPAHEAAATVWTPEAAAAEIKALREEAAKYRREKQAEVKARETAEAQALAEQGKYKELYELATPKLTEYDTLRERYDALIAQVQAANERRIASIPEGMRSLVPEYDDPQRLAAWLDANSAVFAKSPAPSLDGRAGGNGSGAITVTDEEVRDFATRMRIDPRYVDRGELQKLKR